MTPSSSPPPATILANGEIRDSIIANGARLLRGGASAEDVAEQITRDVEDDLDEHSVGSSGMPNILGEVELDAAFMDGATRKLGAVCGLKGFRHPISVARELMKRLPHVLLCGEGAARFAAEIGAERANLLTEDTLVLWRERINAVAPGVGSVGTVSDLIGFTKRVIAYSGKPADTHDTMNVIVRDAGGHIVVCVSTSGIAWKYPGRVGDSPVAGAGFYADERYGAGACMGFGEWTIRHGTTLRAILALKAGEPLQKAGSEAVNDMLRLGTATDAGVFFDEDSPAWVRLLLMDAHGNCGAFSTKRGLTYKIQQVGEDAPTLFEAEYIH